MLFAAGKQQDSSCCVAQAAAPSCSCARRSAPMPCGCVGGVSKLQAAARKFSTSSRRRRALCPSGGWAAPNSCNGEDPWRAGGVSWRLHTMHTPAHDAPFGRKSLSTFLCRARVLVCRRVIVCSVGVKYETWGFRGPPPPGRRRPARCGDVQRAPP